MTTRKYLPIAYLSIFLLWGCATTDDLKKVKSEFYQKTIELKTEDADIRKEIVKINETIVALRNAQAERGADITALNDEIQKLRGQLETFRRDLTILRDKETKETKDIKEKLDQASFKINFIENYLDIGKTDAPVEKGGQRNSAKGRSDKETAYALAYEAFKDGKYEKARADFQNFLNQYPNSEFSDNAQFWIGETYYFEKNYEKAILEYEKVLKNFPQGNRTPHAMLKQGLSLLNLGDKSSAKILLQQVIKDFPNTNQAKIARAKLVELK